MNRGAKTACSEPRNMSARWITRWPNPYSVREVENALDELVQKEPNEFEKAGEVYRWKKFYRFRVGVV